MIQPQQQQLHLLSPPNQPRPTQIPAQPMSNPNNKTIQSTHNIGLVTYPSFPTYCTIAEGNFRSCVTGIVVVGNLVEVRKSGESTRKK